MKNPPSFQFYPGDYLSSSKVQRMSLEAEGAYIRLLAYCWQDGSIPAKTSEMALLCKSDSRRMWYLFKTYLKDCFEVHPTQPERLINAKLEAVRQQQIQYRQRQAEFGKKGYAVKLEKTTVGVASRVPSGVPDKGSLRVGGSTSSSTSSSISNRGIQNKNMSPSGDVVPGYPQDFIDFWKDSTKRGSKLEASRVWKSLHPSESLQVEIHAGMIAWMQTEQWQDETKQPHIAHWLRRRGWEEHIPERKRRNGNPLTPFDADYYKNMKESE